MKSTQRFFFLLVSMFMACSSDDGHDNDVDPPAPIYIDFDMTDAVAVVYHIGPGAINGRTRETGPNSNLYKLNAAGERSVITWTATFKEVIGLRRGLFVSLYQKATESNVYYIVELDNSATRYEGWLQPFVGENEQGDLIFADGMVFRRATRELAKISEKNASLRVVSVSGNFATVRRGADFWVIDTLSGEERPIQNCNGPSIVALDESKVFVDDCSEADLLLFASGERANSYIRPFEIFARTRVGVATLGNYPLADVTSLREYNTSGELTFDVPYQAASGIISLSSSGDFFIVKERTRMVIVRRGEQSAKVILSDVKVTSFSAAGNVLHYVAETKEGQPIVGRYNLETGEDKLVVNLAVNARVHTFE